MTYHFKVQMRTHKMKMVPLKHYFKENGKSIPKKKREKASLQVKLTSLMAASSSSTDFWSLSSNLKILFLKTNLLLLQVDNKVNSALFPC